MSRTKAQTTEMAFSSTIGTEPSGDEPKCLSSESQHQISDYLSHYLGCTEFRERNNLFEEGGKLWQEELKRLKEEREKRISSNTVKGKIPPDDELQNKVDDKLRRNVEICIEELMRIEKLRKALQNSGGHQHLIAHIEESRAKWRRSAANELVAIRMWSGRNEDINNYTADKFLTALKDTAKNYVSKSGTQPSRSYTDRIREQLEQSGKAYEPEDDLKAYVIQWKYDDTQKTIKPESNINIKGHFPDQRLPLNRLLQAESEKGLGGLNDDDEKNKSQDDLSRKLRYFHFPANNMRWVERAIAGYFKEPTPDLRLDHHENGGSANRSHMILRPQYWRGQERGAHGSPVHTRHLRPLCKAVSSNPEKDDEAQNIILFMPYLHWETDRKRIQFADWMKNVSENNQRERSKRNNQNKTNRKERRSDLKKPPWMKDLKQPLRSQTKDIWNVPLKHFNIPKKRMTIDKEEGHGNRVHIQNPLGQYLLDAAALYEAMANYRDQMFIQKYLNEDPPLHPRRTLDQAYYWTLENTDNRDRDQVVYRATRAKSQNFHKYDAENKEWKDHRVSDLDEGCRNCRDNIRKVSKLVMVDQLWMWILDANTVFTFFPRRYGANKHDISGVHKSIRTRLKSAPKNRIRSAFDLGLLIIEECCSTFFDRTKTPDPRQPQVIDQFAQAIADMTNKYTDASQQLWMWTELAKSCYKSNIKPHANLHVALLDVNNEGKLHREIKDIIEEIDIMLYITRIQKEVLKNYVSQVEEIIDPERKFGPRATTRTTNDDTLVTEFNKPAYSNSRPRKPSSAGTSLPQHVMSQEIYDAFMRHAYEMTGKISGHIEELEQLRDSAQTTSDSIKDLLALKQQQASVLQAWQSAKESEEMAKQGQSIMMFTVITIIFAPLSFVTAIFSMQNEKKWTMGYQLKLIFAISFSIALLAILLAFNRWVRVFFPFNSIIYSPLVYLSTLLVVKVPLPNFSIYLLWLRLTHLSRKFTQHIDDTAEGMRAKIMRQEWERKKKREEAERSSSKKGGKKAQVCEEKIEPGSNTDENEPSGRSSSFTSRWRRDMRRKVQADDGENGHAEPVPGTRHEESEVLPKGDK